MTNQQPEWVRSANVWSVSGTSITVAGRLNSPGYLHIVVLDLDSSEPSAQ